jgi:hypothetical protein
MSRLPAQPRANPALPGVHRRQLKLHGLAVSLESHVPGLEPTLGRLLGSFGTVERNEASAVTRGSIHTFEGSSVARRLPSTAIPMHRAGDLTELYAEAERSWLIDERWGMSEVNLFKSQFKSWIVPQPKVDAVRLAELAVLRPLAMLLKYKGLHLLPAAAVSRENFAALVITPFGLERELAGLLAARYRIIGQRWTAVREEGGRCLLLAMPGMVQQRPASPGAAPEWIDLTATNPLSVQPQASCSAVLAIDSGRRPRASLQAWSADDAAMVLRLAWPIPELHPQRRCGQLATRLAQICPCYRVQLSHEPGEWVSLLESLRSAAPARVAA